MTIKKHIHRIGLVIHSLGGQAKKHELILTSEVLAASYGGERLNFQPNMQK
jgi:hypothetical protein